MARFASIVGLACVLACACGNSHPSVESQTHWLQACDTSASCGGTLSCICGVCVAACEKDGSCDVPGRDTQCVMANATAARALCEQPAAKPICLESCTPGSCPSGQSCIAGACVPETGSAKDAGADSGHAHADASMGGSGGNGNGGSGSGGAGSGGAGGAGGPSVDAGSADPCAHVVQCELAPCPTGQRNPVDPNGCTHTCVCEDYDAGTGTLHWFKTCGAPLCGTEPMDDPNVPNCTTQTEGQPCTMADQTCDPVSACGEKLICTDKDPTAGLGGCPISRARYKQDIAYLDEAGLRGYRDQILSMPLASYHYRSAPHSDPQLGFIIEDIEPSVAVSGDHVNLYGYLSMAVAAIQVQQRQIADLEREVHGLREQVASEPPAVMCTPSGTTSK